MDLRGIVDTDLGLDALPQDPLLLICTSLDLHSLSALSQTCTRLNEVADSDFLWKRLYTDYVDDEPSAADYIAFSGFVGEFMPKIVTNWKTLLEACVLHSELDVDEMCDEYVVPNARAIVASQATLAKLAEESRENSYTQAAILHALIKQCCWLELQFPPELVKGARNCYSFAYLEGDTDTLASVLDGIDVVVREKPPRKEIAEELAPFLPLLRARAVDAEAAGRAMNMGDSPPLGFDRTRRRSSSASAGGGDLSSSLRKQTLVTSARRGGVSTRPKLEPLVDLASSSPAVPGIRMPTSKPAPPIRGSSLGDVLDGESPPQGLRVVNPRQRRRSIAIPQFIVESEDGSVTSSQGTNDLERRKRTRSNRLASIGAAAIANLGRTTPDSDSESTYDGNLSQRSNTGATGRRQRKSSLSAIAAAAKFTQSMKASVTMESTIDSEDSAVGGDGNRNTGRLQFDVPTMIPDEYHVIKTSQIRPSDPYNLMDTEYNEPLYSTKVFPARHPSGSAQVTHLRETLTLMIQRVGGANALSNSLFSEDDRLKHVEGRKRVYDIILHELARQVAASHWDRGMLLTDVVQDREDLYNELHELYETKLVRYESEVARLTAENAKLQSILNDADVDSEAVRRRRAQEAEEVVELATQLREWRRETDKLRQLTEEKYERQLAFRREAESWREKRREFDAEINALRRQLEFEQRLLLEEQDRAAALQKKMVQKLRSQKKKIAKLEDASRMDASLQASLITGTGSVVASNSLFGGNLVRFDKGVQTGIDGESVTPLTEPAPAVTLGQSRDAALAKKNNRWTYDSDYSDDGGERAHEDRGSGTHSHSTSISSESDNTEFDMDCEFVTKWLGGPPTPTDVRTVTAKTRQWLVDFVFTLYMAVIDESLEEDKITFRRPFLESVYHELVGGNFDGSAGGVGVELYRKRGFDLIATVQSFRDTLPMLETFAQFLEGHHDTQVVEFYIFALACVVVSPYGLHSEYGTEVPAMDVWKATQLARVLFCRFGIQRVLSATDEIEAKSINVGGDVIICGIDSFLEVCRRQLSFHRSSVKVSLEECFRQLDSDGDGLLNHAQCHELVHRMGWDLMNERRVVGGDLSLFSLAVVASESTVGVTVEGVLAAADTARLRSVPYVVPFVAEMGLHVDLEAGEEEELMYAAHDAFVTAIPVIDEALDKLQVGHVFDTLKAHAELIDGLSMAIEAAQEENDIGSMRKRAEDELTLVCTVWQSLSVLHLEGLRDCAARDLIDPDLIRQETEWLLSMSTKRLVMASIIQPAPQSPTRADSPQAQ